MGIVENIKIALTAIRSNFLRALLTLLIIAVGITCLVGILTAIDTILFSMSDSFNRIGANSFYVLPANQGRQNRKNGKEQKRGEPISFEQAYKFKDGYDFADAKVSVSIFLGSSTTLSYQKEKTNPTTIMYGIDENYLEASAFEIETGRNFSVTEVENGDHKVILGKDLIKKLFNGNYERAINKVINIGSRKYKVIGCIKEKGSSMNDALDRRIFIPLVNAKRYYVGQNDSYRIVTATNHSSQIDNAVSAAIGKMRNVRRLRASQENDFEIRKSDGILQKLKEITTELRLATIAIALMTLLGAAIGLMNIMLVSVTERTREIGVRKALGATRFNILFQFLMEAVVITIMGGIVGIILGIAMGFGLAVFIKGKFVVPVEWMALGIIVCIVVGVISGLYPALKASRLDPIEALRYE